MIKRNNKGQYIAVSINIDCLKDESFRYWYLGLMAADGHLHGKKYVNISQSGVNGLNTVNYIKTKFKYKGKTYHYKNAHSIQFCSRTLFTILNDYKITERKTYTLELSNKIDNKVFRNFLRGYIDGDGCVGIYKRGNSKKHLVCSFVGTKSLIISIHDKLRIKHGVRKIEHCKNLFEIYFYGKNAILFLNWLYSDSKVYKSYKYYKFINYIKNRNDKFTKYEKIKIKVKKLLKTNMNCETIAKKVKLPFQTIYRWRNQWKN